jgi:hypothetical protein
MTDVVSPPATRNGPADPTPRAIAALRPLHLDDARLDPGGLLGGWQDRNATATLPHCIGQLEASGALGNVRRLLAGAGEGDVAGADAPKAGTAGAAGVGAGQSGAGESGAGEGGAAGGRGGFSGMWFADSDIYKTLEAVAWELARDSAVTDRDALGAVLDDFGALLAAAQDADGYLNSYFQSDHRDQQWRELRWSHELYCAGHLIQAAVAAARVGVGKQLIAVARRFADLLVERFGPGGVDAVCGHPEVETALVELYRVTGHRPYLTLAQRFVALRGHGLLGEDRMGRRYYQDHLPVLDAGEVTGHAVRQLYLLAGVVDVAVEAGDPALLAAAERLWASAFDARTYLTGAHGSRHRDEAFGDPYELPPDRAYGETCAAIASFQWNWRMLLATGGHRYADEMERVLHNGIAVATALDGRHFFYSNPLQLRTGHDGSTEDAPSRRLPWYSCACCPPNLARLMASLHSYLATADDTGMQVHLYGSGTLRAGGAEVSVRTAYPWTGRVALTVRRAPAGPWTLALRIPGWCTDHTLDVRDPSGDVHPGGDVHRDGGPVDGYLRLTRRWEPGTTVVLDLHMPPRMLAAHPHVDAVRGCVALTRGPLVYCLEQADLPPGAALEDIRLDTGTPAEIAERDEASPIPVTLNAHGTVATAASPALYHDLRPSAGRSGGASAGPSATTPGAPGIRLTAVPYFLWGNRTPGPMRVWIPAVPADGQVS